MMKDPDQPSSAAAGTRRALLAALLRSEGVEHAGPSVIPRWNGTGLAPLSFAQQRLWFLDRLAPGNPFYNISSAVRLPGPLDTAALEQAFNEVVRRHAILRTTFAEVAGEPYQIIAPALTLALSVTDLQGLPETEREAEAVRLATEEARRPFDLSQGPLVRLALLHLGERAFVVLVTLHHIVADGYSMGLFLHEMSVLYSAFAVGHSSPLRDLPIQYVDFAAWQRDWFRGEVRESQLAYWKRQLADLPILRLPADRPRPPVQSYRGGSRPVMLPGPLVAALKTFSLREGATLFITLLAAFKTLLHRYSGQDDLVVGVPVTNRNRPETEELIGLFVNTLVLRSNVAGDPTFRRFVGRVREAALGAYAHQDLPFEMLVEQLQPQRDLSHNPLFQVAFQLFTPPRSNRSGPETDLPFLPVERGTSLFDLSLNLTEASDGIRGELQYSSDLFDDTTVTRMASHFRTLLEGVLADPDQHLSALPLVTGEERRHLLVDWAGATSRLFPEACLHQLFETQAEHTPDAVALVCGEQHLTYAALNRQANHLAHYLHSLGVSPEQLVGICLGRSTDLVVGLLAILKAGGAYLPLDPHYPASRLAFMLADAHVSVLITREELASRFTGQSVRLVCLDHDNSALSNQRDGTPTSGVSGDNLAYVLYTSGSTGQPKGVAIEHRSAAAFVRWACQFFVGEDLAGVLAATSVCFDLSVFELFAPLSCGGTVLLAEDVLALPDLPAAPVVTLVNSVPSVMGALLPSGLPPSLRVVNLAGEPLSSALAQQLYQQRSIRQLFNLYGPTETTTYATAALVPRTMDRPPGIGRPLPYTWVYVLDSRMEPVPVGVPGELYIGGAGLARGYLSQPGLTAERFVADRHCGWSGARLYRSGDLVRYRSDGSLDFLGRTDRQVKVRGFRVEPGEVEAVLGQHPELHETLVLAQPDAAGAAGLVAYVVPRPGFAPTAADLRSFLHGRLPAYLLPSAFVIMPALPIGPNGKVDRMALPAPGLAKQVAEEAFVAPRSQTEEKVAKIWSQVLGLEQIGIQDNFFELGGYSLRAIQVLSRIRDDFQVEVPLQRFFEGPTVADLALAIVQSRVEQADDDNMEQLLAELERLSLDEARALLTDAMSPLLGHSSTR